MKPRLQPLRTTAQPSQSNHDTSRIPLTTQRRATNPKSKRTIHANPHQQKRALEETKAVFPSLRERIANARERLQAQLESATNDGEIEQAKKVLAEAIEQQKDDPDSAHPSGGAPQ